jgi:hypothetical protein
MRLPALALLSLTLTAVLVPGAARSHAARPPQQPAAPAPADSLHHPFDQLLDLYVRDGEVYYAALKSDRAKLDRYIASLASVEGSEGWPRERQLALWINAYNACVLQSVVSNYPIRGRSSAYPPDSIRQVPGAFDRLVHRIAGRSLTLDSVENTVLAGFHDPRVSFALGRGAVGGGRLRSEAYTGAALEGQLRQVAAEVVARPDLVRIDQLTKRVVASPIFGWREAEFVSAYATAADPRFANRSPIERAIVAFIVPNLLPSEVEFLNRNDFQLSYGTFDWRLNDLARRR